MNCSRDWLKQFAELPTPIQKMMDGYIFLGVADKKQDAEKIKNLDGLILLKSRRDIL